MTALSAVGLGFAFVTPWCLLFAAPLVLAGYITAVLGLSAHRLAPRGGDVQHRLHDVIATTLAAPPGSEVLDIGCGSGHLAIVLAIASPGSTVTGIDSWGPTWAYSREQCRRNAEIEGVADRVRFQHASAAALPFAAATFDAVVSCMTLHEVRDANPRARALTEALRVLRPGGRFVFVDPFADPAYYASLDEVRATVGAAGATIQHATAVSDLLPLRFPLNHPKVLGRVILLAGRIEPSRR